MQDNYVTLTKMHQQIWTRNKNLELAKLTTGEKFVILIYFAEIFRDHNVKFRRNATWDKDQHNK